MAQPDIIRGTYFVLGSGNGGSPETFTALCGITTKSFSHPRNTSPQFTRDCAVPEDIPVQRLIITGESWKLTGSGVLNRANLATIQALDDNLTHNWRYWFTEPATDLVFQGYYQGPAIMTDFSITSSDDNFAQISLTLDSDGAWAWTTV